MAEQILQTLGRYQIRGELGRGGFATVYRALDTTLDRQVALKVLHPQLLTDRVFAERFRKEARALAGLRHPNIITVYEVGEAEGRLYIAMELAQGTSLAQAIAERGSIPWSETLSILKPVCDALDYAHAQGIVHRDLKPANILLDKDRGALLTDFGFARLMGESSVSMSLSGGILGTPAYIAPEVWELESAKPPADIYALGCILYEMITGHVLFAGKTPMQAMRAHDRGPQLPSTWQGGVPTDLTAVLTKALARQPEARYPSAAAIWFALNDLEAQAQVNREQAERAALAVQWKAEAQTALASGEWRVARMAVGRWLAITPEDPAALATRSEIDRREAEARAAQEAAERAQHEAEDQTRQEAERQAAEEATQKERERQQAERRITEEADRKKREQQAAEQQARDEAARQAREEQLRQAHETARQAEDERRKREQQERAQRERAEKEAAQRKTADRTSVTPATPPSPPKRRVPIWVWIAGATLLICAACGLVYALRPLPVATPAPTAAPRPKPSPQATTVPPTKLADTIVLAIQSEPDTLYPFGSSMLAAAIVNSALMPGCLRQNETTDWVALGCERVPTLENGDAKFVGDGSDMHLEVIYHIRRGWRWTDGTPVVAKDAVFAWELRMDPDFEAVDRTIIEKIYNVVAVDDLTIAVKFMSEKQARDAAAGTLTGNVPFGKFKDDYQAYSQQQGPVIDPAYWSVFPGWLPSHILSNVSAKNQLKSDYAKKPVGDGAYVLQEWTPANQIVLEKSSVPFPLGDAKTKTVIFRFFPDAASILAALQQGAVDATTGDSGLTYDNAPAIDKLASGSAFKANYVPGYAWEHIDLNTTKFPLDDVRVRQALYYAIDKKAMLDKLYNGKPQIAELPGAILKTNSWAYTDNFTRYSYDKAKAQALLKDAGWDCSTMPCNKSGQKLEITLATTDRADRQALAQFLQPQWQSIGVGVNVQIIALRGLFAPCANNGPLTCRTFDAAIFTWIGTDEPTFLDLYGCNSIPTKDNNYSGQNYPGYCSKDADYTLNMAEQNNDIALYRDKRKPYLEKYFQIWTGDVPAIPLYVSVTPYIYRAGFKGYKPGPTLSTADAWNAWEWELSQ